MKYRWTWRLNRFRSTLSNCRNCWMWTISIVPRSWFLRSISCSILHHLTSNLSDTRLSRLTEATPKVQSVRTDLSTNLTRMKLIGSCLRMSEMPSTLPSTSNNTQSSSTSCKALTRRSSYFEGFSTIEFRTFSAASYTISTKNSIKSCRKDKNYLIKES